MPKAAAAAGALLAVLSLSPFSAYAAKTEVPEPMEFAERREIPKEEWTVTSGIQYKEAGGEKAYSVSVNENGEVAVCTGGEVNIYAPDGTFMYGYFLSSSEKFHPYIAFHADSLEVLEDWTSYQKYWKYDRNGALLEHCRIPNTKENRECNPNLYKYANFSEFTLDGKTYEFSSLSGKVSCINADGTETLFYHPSGGGYLKGNFALSEFGTAEEGIFNFPNATPLSETELAELSDFEVRHEEDVRNVIGQISVNGENELALRTGCYIHLYDAEGKYTYSLYKDYISSEKPVIALYDDRILVYLQTERLLLTLDGNGALRNAAAIPKTEENEAAVKEFISLHTTITEIGGYTYSENNSLLVRTANDGGRVVIYRRNNREQEEHSYAALHGMFTLLCAPIALLPMIEKYREAKEEAKQNK